MNHRQLIKVLVGIAILIGGLASIGLGLLFALVTFDADWLWLSFAGIIAIVVGVVLAVREMHRSYRFWHPKRNQHTKRPIKYVKPE